MGWYEEFAKLDETEKQTFLDLEPGEQYEQKVLWSEPEVKEVSETLERLANRSDSLSISLLISWLTNRTHRALHSTLLNDFVLGLIKAWAGNYQAGRFDGRNDYICKYCFEVVTVLKENKLL